MASLLQHHVSERDHSAHEGARVPLLPRLGQLLRRAAPALAVLLAVVASVPPPVAAELALSVWLALADARLGHERLAAQRRHLDADLDRLPATGAAQRGAGVDPQLREARADCVDAALRRGAWLAVDGNLQLVVPIGKLERLGPAEARLADEDEALEESGYWYGQEWSDLDFDI